jgi:hypothetical protein
MIRSDASAPDTDAFAAARGNAAAGGAAPDAARPQARAKIVSARRSARLAAAFPQAPHGFAPEPSPVPGWVQPQEPVTDDAQAAFLAGAALHCLDRVVRAQEAWAGAWRQRLALGCGVAACRLAGRGEDEAALRDAWAFRPKGGGAGASSAGALGPGGNLYAAWRLLAAGPALRDAAALRQVAELLGLADDGRLDAVRDGFGEIAGARSAPPFAAASMAARVMALGSDFEPLAWWLADFALAQAMRWPRPVPLFMAQAFSPALRVEAGRRTRLRPGDEGFQRALCLALVEGASQACRLAGEIARRAARLREVTPTLRTRGAGEAIRLLLDDEAVPGTLATGGLSRFASRRLFQRLEDLGAVRELSGRPTFRLFGL